jgi:hypothetical protein
MSRMRLYARFADEERWKDAEKQWLVQGWEPVAGFRPFAPVEVHASPGPPFGLWVALAGLGCASVMFLFETYVAVWSWPLSLGGKPDFSWPAFVPPAFEAGILGAATVALGLGLHALTHQPPETRPLDFPDEGGFWWAVEGEDGEALYASALALGTEHCVWEVLP